jgi:hypothetical protein
MIYGATSVRQKEAHNSTQGKKAQVMAGLAESRRGNRSEGITQSAVNEGHAMNTAMALATGSGSGDITFPGFWLAFMLGIIAGMVVMAWMRKG